MVEVFRNAPITEALIDIRTDLPATVSLTDLEALHARIIVDYPQKQLRTYVQSSLDLRGEKEPRASVQSQVMGYMFKSPDGVQVAQFRLDGFSFSRLRPYVRWESLYEEAGKLWDIYREGARPLRVTRLATRYINSIQIPFKRFDYDEYFTAAPRVPERLPQVLSHFFTRLVIPFAEYGATAVVVLTPSNSPDAIHSTVILDIDAFVEEILGPEDAKIDEVFAILRDIKNEIFFSSVTDKAKELFR
jgi:uncharacterized protein (TIGR04255 family)